MLPTVKPSLGLPTAALPSKAAKWPSQDPWAVSTYEIEQVSLPEPPIPPLGLLPSQPLFAVDLRSRQREADISSLLT